MKNIIKIRPFWLDSINIIKNSDVWKNQLTTSINFIFPIDNAEECEMHLKSDDIEFKMKDEAHEVIK